MLNEQLTKACAGQSEGLLKYPGGAELASRNVEFDGAPRRTRQQHDFLEQRRGPATQRHEGDVHCIEAGEIGVGGELGVKDQMPGLLAMGFFPERDKAENLLGLLAFAQVRVGIAKGMSIGVLCEEGENALLPTRAHRYVMALDDGALAIVRYGMKIEVEGTARQQLIAGNLELIGAQERGV